MNTILVLYTFKHMKALLLTLLLISLLSVGVYEPSAFALSMYPTEQVGHDVSWPNCNATPPSGTSFGIVGITGGLVFHPNPCLFQEAHWFTNLTLYMNTGYAGKGIAKKYAAFPVHCSLSDESCLAYNFGYNAGIYAINYAASQYVHTNIWWLDVETENSWSTNTEYNRASLAGMVNAIQQNTLLPTIGFYSYPGQWDSITGSWYNGYPNWAATGSSSYQAAVSYCHGQAFTGGPTWLTQYTRHLDGDYVCKQ
jgi:hypothetical protein